MLTRAYINKVARLMDQIGELRPGFLQDTASGLEGAAEPVRSVFSERKTSRKSKRVVRLKIGVGARPTRKKTRAALK